MRVTTDIVYRRNTFAMVISIVMLEKTKRIVQQRRPHGRQARCNRQRRKHQPQVQDVRVNLTARITTVSLIVECVMVMIIAIIMKMNWTAIVSTRVKMVTASS